MHTASRHTPMPGMLYYRTDLLPKYGFNKPPKTIRDGERKNGKTDFQRFVFQGKASESVTCNAVERIFSYAGGTIIDPDKKIAIDDPNAVKAWNEFLFALTFTITDNRKTVPVAISQFSGTSSYAQPWGSSWRPQWPSPFR